MLPAVACVFSEDVERVLLSLMASGRWKSHKMPESDVPVGPQTKHTTLGQAQAEVQEAVLERTQHATWQEDLRAQEPVPVAVLLAQVAARRRVAMAAASSRDAPQPAAVTSN